MKAFFVGLWEKVKTSCLGSLTMAWSYIVTAFGTVLANIDTLALVMGDPSLNQQIANVFGDAKMLGKWLLAVGVVTAIARLKGLLTKPKEP